MDAPGTSGVKPTTSVKLVLLGEAAVGKSSLVLRFVSDDFQENKEPTIGAAFLTQKCTLANRTIKFEIWDTAGQERFASLAPMYYRNAQAALVVYDITKPTSFIKARHWVNELKAQASPGIIIALVGNKLDLEKDGVAADADSSGNPGGDATEASEPTDQSAEPVRKVAVEEGQKLAEDEGLLFLETSAKSGYNVKQVFMAIASKIPEDAGSSAGATKPSGGAGRQDALDLTASTTSSGAPSCNC